MRTTYRPRNLPGAAHEPTRFQDPPSPLDGQTFLGYPRGGGRAGTRNYIAVISTVNCSASVSRYVARRFDRGLLQRDFPNVDGVVAFTHGGGCGMPFKGLAITRFSIACSAELARHPNIGGYLLIGLGCETADDRRICWKNSISCRSAAARGLSPFPESARGLSPFPQSAEEGDCPASRRHESPTGPQHAGSRRHATRPSTREFASWPRCCRA